MNKQQRKASVKRWKAVERADLIAAMPVTPEQLNRLLNYLSYYLKTCDHTTRLTAIFLHVEQLEKEKVLAWLVEHGGFCDCEVLANLADLDNALQAPPPPPYARPQTDRKRPARKLRTAFGWDCSNLPAPWRVGNLYAADEPLQLHIGKKGGCSIQVNECPMPPGDRTADAYWSGLWYARTELPYKASLKVTHHALELAETFSSTLVQAPSWTPVFCWIIPQAESWHLEVRTEGRRCHGDLPQITSLISHMASK